MASIQDTLDKAVVDITAMDDAVDSALKLIDTLVAAVKANKNDPAALNAALTAIEAKKQALADSVAANTPAEEPPAETPPAETPPVETPPGETPNSPRTANRR